MCVCVWEVRRGRVVVVVVVVVVASFDLPLNARISLLFSVTMIPCNEAIMKCR